MVYILKKVYQILAFNVLSWKNVVKVCFGHTQKCCCQKTGLRLCSDDSCWYSPLTSPTCSQPTHVPLSLAMDKTELLVVSATRRVDIIFRNFFATDWCWALSHRNLLTESGSWAAPWRPLLPWHRPHLHASWPPAGGNPESSAMPICAVSSPNAVYTTYKYGEKWPVGWLLKNAGRFAGLGKSTRLEFSRSRHRPGFACWLFCRRGLAG